LNEKGIFKIKAKIETNNFSLIEFLFVYLNTYLYSITNRKNQSEIDSVNLSEND